LFVRCGEACILDSRKYRGGEVVVNVTSTH
jgi:hypothetical protein